MWLCFGEIKFASDELFYSVYLKALKCGGQWEYGIAEFEVEGGGKKDLVTDNCFPRARKIEISSAKISCLINAGFVLLLDHLLLGNDDVEKF